MEQSSFARVIRHLVHDRRIIGPTVLFVLGYVLVALPAITNVPLEQLLTELGPKYLGYALTIGGAVWFYIEFFLPIWASVKMIVFLK